MIDFTIGHTIVAANIRSPLLRIVADKVVRPARQRGRSFRLSRRRRAFEAERCLTTIGGKADSGRPNADRISLSPPVKVVGIRRLFDCQRQAAGQSLKSTGIDTALFP
ncbi:MAG: hypothetical protein IPM55_00915 [Acidobacteria bacterium]|nr:hypothetical protein [Acidobacteriota bacterium]